MKQYVLLEVWEGKESGVPVQKQNAVAIITVENEDVTTQDVLKSLGRPVPGTTFVLSLIPTIPLLEEKESPYDYVRGFSSLADIMEVIAQTLELDGIEKEESISPLNLKDVNLRDQMRTGWTYQLRKDRYTDIRKTWAPGCEAVYDKNLKFYFITGNNDRDIIRVWDEYDNLMWDFGDL
jgi:hypothetical protein